MDKTILTMTVQLIAQVNDSFDDFLIEHDCSDLTSRKIGAIQQSLNKASSLMLSLDSQGVII